jgi:alkylation response protein AidB-like acyl-CoA dehydrogenase
MADYIADVRDIKFVLFDQLQIDKLLASEQYSSFSREDLDMIIDEAHRFAREVLGPINVAMDREGCSIRDGKVKVPEVMREPWKLFAENGWLALSKSPEYGGQGAPESLAIAACDMFFGACISFNLGALLGTGAAHLIEVWGTEELKKTYVRNMYSGKWGGTMCLTESQAGSDVGASTTRARKQGDHYLIEGEKVFITFGEHDLTENIVHAVLARVEGAPKGTKGLSLFVVPKYRVNPDGSLGAFNDVVCSGIEHKLGIHGSPTCTLVFGGNGDCHGYLLGEENGGMRAMFQMMNEARISVGLQGAAMANAAYQAALAYSKERLQGSDIRAFKDPNAPRVPIIRHPDVRMMLLRQKAYAEGCRALLIFAAYCADRERVATDDKDRATWHGLLEILTPICKAYCSDMAFRVTEWALQCYGGYGYLKEYPAEQYLRDCKIASIYEGTNGIQAMDLVARKLSMEGGAPLKALIGHIKRFVEQHRDHPALGAEVAAVGQANQAWMEVNGSFAKAASEGKLLGPLLNASGYLSLCGDLLLGKLLVEQGIVAFSKLQGLCEKAGIDPKDGKAVAAAARENSEICYLDGKVKTARFFAAYELPLATAKSAAIRSGDMSALHIVWEGE